MQWLADLIAGFHIPTNEELAAREEAYDRWWKEQAKNIKVAISEGKQDPYEASQRRAMQKPPAPKEIKQPVPKSQGSIEADKAYEERVAKEAEDKRIREGNAEIEALRERARLYQEMSKDRPVLGIPGTDAYIKGMPEEKLMAIREQALAKGGASPALKEHLLSQPRTGGTFNVAPDSPEIQQRLAARDKWLQIDAPLSQAQFMLTPEQVQRNPQGIAAAEQLRRIAEERRAGAQQEMTNEIVRMIGDSKGRVPYEQANQLAMLGFNIPVRAIGSSQEEATQFLDTQIMRAQADMQRVDPHDMTGVGQIVGQFSRSAQLFAEQLKRKVLAGEMSPDDAMEAFWQYASQNAMQLGLLQGPSAPQQASE